MKDQGLLHANMPYPKMHNDRTRRADPFAVSVK